VSLRRPSPPYIRLLNTVGRILERAQFAKPELCADQLMVRAQRRTGLHDWGDTSFRTGLQHLTTALHEQARLSQVGRFAAYFNLLDLLCVRLRLIDYRQRRAEVAGQRIVQPLFILGLPRTGTTILYELMAQDPRFRSPATWEVARPLPPPTAQSQHADPRIKAVQRLLAVLEKLSPGFNAIHAIGASLPQECVYLLASAFSSEQFGYMYNIPDYRAWLLQHDMSDAYRWHAHFLQHLQVDLAHEHWVLKSPAHLGSLRFLFAQYPDARVVWTHRRPLQAVTSFSSLTHALRGGFSDRIDPVATGAQELRYFAQAVRLGMADREALDHKQFFDVGFDAICTDPLAVVHGIYQQFGLALSAEAEVRMRDYLRRHPRGLYGEHRYRAETFGLDSVQEASEFGEYLERYGAWL
jgi:hypothetical protein